MSHELSPNHTDTEATIVLAVGPMRQLLQDEFGRKLLDAQKIETEAGTFMLGYEYASFEWKNPRLVVDVGVGAGEARGIYKVDCRPKDYQDTPVLKVEKFDLQQKSVRPADDEELEDIARLVSGVTPDYVKSVLEQRRAENKRTTTSSKLAAVFSRKR